MNFNPLTENVTSQRNSIKNSKQILLTKISSESKVFQDFTTVYLSLCSLGRFERKKCTYSSSTIFKLFILYFRLSSVPQKFGKFKFKFFARSENFQLLKSALQRHSQSFHPRITFFSIFFGKRDKNSLVFLAFHYLLL